MSESKLLLIIEDGVAVVTLNRPAARNALDTEMVGYLRDALGGLADSEDVRACILTGAGTAFCAGADLKERARMTANQQRAVSAGIRECADLAEELPVPVIAAINGPAYAGGLELALGCDARVASDRASFALPEVRLGIFPGAGGPIRLPRLVGWGRARLMVFGGEPLGAEEALRIGLVDLVVPHQRLMEEALRIARSIAANSPEAVRAVKQLMNRAWGMPYAEAVKLSESLRTPLDRNARWDAGLK